MDDLLDLKEKLDRDLEAAVVSGRVLLDHLRLIDEASRKTAAYADPRYAPFYYHLGKYVKPDNVCEIGFTLGLLAACLFRSHTKAKKFFGYKQPSPGFANHRIGKANLRLTFKGESDFYVGDIYDEQFSQKISPNPWGLIIINEESSYDRHLEYLDFFWPHLPDGGLVVAEYVTRHRPAGEAFHAFAESKNRRPVVFRTRYGTGALQK